MCAHGHNEESSLLGNIFPIRSKKQGKIEQQAALMKSLAEQRVEKQKLETAKEQNRIKTVKIVVIAFSSLIIVAAIIIAVIKLKNKKVS